MNRYYIFADDMYDRGAGMASCQIRTNDKEWAIEKAKDIKKNNDIVSIWDVVEEKEISFD